MENFYRRSERERAEGVHLSEMALETVWSGDEESHLDAAHARALSDLGFGFTGGRFPVH